MTAPNKPAPAQVPAFSNVANDIPLRGAETAALLLDLVGECLSIVGGGLTAPDPRNPAARVSLGTPDELFAWIDTRLRVFWHRRGVTKPEFFQSLKLAAGRYEWATAYPHFPALPDVLYTRAAPAPAQTGYLDELVDRFPAASPVDRTLIKAALLTPGAGLPPGTRPCFVITARAPAATQPPDPRRGRGTGKSTLLAVNGRLWGGYFPLRPHGSAAQAVSDLLSQDAADLRVVGVDNLKSFRFSSEEFEGMVTAPQVGGHRLYHGHATRPNHFTYFVTVNGASFSADMADRSVVIELTRPAPDPAWLRTTTRLVDEHRGDIFADMAALFATKPTPPAAYPRHAEWARAVLGRLPEPDVVAATIVARQRQIDEDDAQAEDVVDLFGRMIAHEAGAAGVAGKRVFVPSVVAARWLTTVNRRFEGGQAAAYLKHLEHPRLKYYRKNARRGYIWTGPSAPAGAPVEAPAFSPTGRPR